MGKNKKAVTLRYSCAQPPYNPREATEWAIFIPFYQGDKGIIQLSQGGYIYKSPEMPAEQAPAELARLDGQR